MLSQRIQQHFIDAADLNYQCAQTLATPVEAAVHAVLACVTGGGKVLACGMGSSAATARSFADHFVTGFERERPELPALALDAGTGFARQVRALGGGGDVLLVLAANGAAEPITDAIAAAHERDMTVVALCGARSGALGPLLKDTDVLVSVPHERLARILEVHHLVLHCICDGVDTQLLGDGAQPEEPT